MVKQTQTIRPQKPTNCLSVFNHFVGLAVKGLNPYKSPGGNYIPENHNTNMVTTKRNKTIGLLRQLQNLLPRTALITIYKAFVTLHLDYGDILYDQAFVLSTRVHSV